MTEIAETPAEVAARLRAEADACDRRAEESFARCDTDGFVSQFCSGLTAREKRLQAEIVENGGVWTFEILTDLDGNYVHARPVQGQYGMSWMLLDENGERTGEYVPFMPKRRDTLAKRGYCEGYAEFEAKAKIMGSGRGLSGLANAWVGTTKKGWDPRPVRILTVDRWNDPLPED